MHAAVVEEFLSRRVAGERPPSSAPTDIAVAQGVCREHDDLMEETL